MMSVEETSAIEEKLRKKIEIGYTESLRELELQSKAGMLQREEIIKTLKTDKKKLQSELQVKSKEIEVLKGKLASLERQYRELEQTNKQGEQLMTSQVRDLTMAQESLQAKLHNEIIQRKKLHNVLEDIKGKIRVFCRVRPLSKYEQERQSHQILKVSDQFTLKFKMIQEGKSSVFGSQTVEQEFNFDSCFSTKAQQEEIFEDTKSLIQSALDGYNVCIFAYGQTGSGKTYTMQGVEGSPGIVPRAIEELYRQKQKMESNGHYIVSLECYMVQLYIDNLIDCFSSQTSSQSQLQKKLDIREDHNTGMIFIQNTTILPIINREEASQAFERGIKSRKVSQTQMNDESSRSHMVFAIIIQTINTETKQRTKSKISFVDLAGSERYDK